MCPRPRRRRIIRRACRRTRASFAFDAMQQLHSWGKVARDLRDSHAPAVHTPEDHGSTPGKLFTRGDSRSPTSSRKARRSPTTNAGDRQEHSGSSRPATAARRRRRSRVLQDPGRLSGRAKRCSAPEKTARAYGNALLQNLVMVFDAAPEVLWVQIYKPVAGWARGIVLQTFLPTPGAHARGRIRVIVAPEHNRKERRKAAPRRHISESVRSAIVCTKRTTSILFF